MMSFAILVASIKMNVSVVDMTAAKTNTTPNPTITDFNTVDSTGAPGHFISYITGLMPGTLYYIRTYAINSAGTAYGDE